MNLRSLISLICLVILTATSVFLGLSIVLFRPFKGHSNPEQPLVIERGASLPEISRTLKDHGIIPSEEIFEWYVRLTGQAATLQAGEYLFKGPVDLFEVSRMLRLGLVHYRKLTVPEGLTLREIARRLDERDFGSEDNFLQAMTRVDWITGWDPEASDNLEGYLFPETYFFSRPMSEEEIVQSIVENFSEQWTSRHSMRARELNLTVREVITLASLIEEETGLAEERPLVSSVFHNRLKRNLKLACDPTVIYAVSLAKEFDGIIHRSDLEFDSPYNTYLYPGLPPGPISNPGMAAIEAALYPAEGDFLYFVSKNDGGHVFSSSYRDHRRAVARYQR